MSICSLHTLPFLLLVFMQLFLFSCEDQTKGHDRLNVGFSQGLGSHPWRSEMNHAMEIQASLHSDVDLKIYKADGSIKQQIRDIERMMNDGTDVIIISAINPDSLVAIVSKVYKKGIPVILLDRKIIKCNGTEKLSGASRRSL